MLAVTHECVSLVRQYSITTGNAMRWIVTAIMARVRSARVTCSRSAATAAEAGHRPRARSWETDDGTKRSVVEMTVDDLGPSLRRAVAKVTEAHPRTRQRQRIGQRRQPSADAYQRTAAPRSRRGIAAGRRGQVRRDDALRGRVR